MEIITFSGIILSIQRYFMISSVCFVIRKPGTEEQLKLNGMQKILNINNVMVTSLYPEIILNEQKRKIHQHRNPLYVIYNHHIIKEIKNVQNMSNAVWLVYVMNNTTSFELLYGINIPFDCEFLIVHHCSLDRICLSEVYRVAAGLPLQERHVGIWDDTYTFKYAHINWRDMGGHAVNIVTAMNPPYTVLKKVSAGNNLLSGIFGELWTTLEQHLHFKSVILEPQDRAWGVLLENGSWNGMIAMILKGQAEVAVAQFTMTSQRSEVIDFMSQLSQGRYCVFMKNPGSEPNVWKSFLAPFSEQLWIAIIISYFIIAVFLKCVGNAQFDNENTFTNTIFVVYISLLQQSEAVKNKSAPYRMVILLCYVMAVTFLGAYSASLISSLAVRTIHLPFETFEELAKDHSYQVGIRKYSPENAYFKDTNISFLSAIYNRIAAHQNNNQKSPKDGVDSMCKRRDKYVYISTDFLVEELIKDTNCKVVILQKACIKTSLSMVIKKNSPYRKIWMYSLTRLRVNGILKRAHRKTQIQDLHEEDWITVSNQHITPLLSILGIGIIMSTVLFIIENLFSLANQTMFNM